MVAWIKETVKILEGIYDDFATIYSFTHSKVHIEHHGDSLLSGSINEFVDIRATMDSKIDVLRDLYDELRWEIKSPLRYFPEKTQIWFYDFVCQLKPETNESELCRFMFRFGIGEWRELAEI